MWKVRPTAFWPLCFSSLADRAKVDRIEDEIMGKSFGPKPPRPSIRQEFLLENAPAVKVMGFLQGQYKEVEFIPRPKRNGFYAVGSRHDILEMRKDVPQLDKAP